MFVDCAVEQEGPAQTESAFLRMTLVRYIADVTSEQCALPVGLSRRESNENKYVWADNERNIANPRSAQSVNRATSRWHRKRLEKMKSVEHFNAEKPSFRSEQYAIERVIVVARSGNRLLIFDDVEDEFAIGYRTKLASFEIGNYTVI